MKPFRFHKHDGAIPKRDPTLTVQAVNRHERQLALSNGATVPITNMFDLEGDQTDDPDEAVTAVGGADDIGWFSVILSTYHTPTHH